MWDNMHRVLTTWKVHCQEFLLGFYYIGIIYLMIAYIIELNFQPLSLTQRSSWYHVVQSSNHMVGLSDMGCPHMSHLSINYQVCSKGPTMNNKTLQSLRKFQGFRGRTETKARPLFGLKSNSLLHSEVLWELRENFSIFSSECYYYWLKLSLRYLFANTMQLYQSTFVIVKVIMIPCGGPITWILSLCCLVKSD